MKIFQNLKNYFNNILPWLKYQLWIFILKELKEAIKVWRFVTSQKWGKNQVICLLTKDMSKTSPLDWFFIWTSLSSFWAIVQKILSSSYLASNISKFIITKIFTSLEFFLKGEKNKNICKKKILWPNHSFNAVEAKKECLRICIIWLSVANIILFLV